MRSTAGKGGPRNRRATSAWMDSRLMISLALALALTTLALTAAPQWWEERNVLRSGGVAKDYAMVNQGQLKNMARGARDELNARVKGGAGPVIDGMIANWIGESSAATDYAPANLGQLKAVAKPFYDRLIEVGVATGYPWTTTTADDRDYGVANLGQLKSLFNFTIPPPPESPENLSATSSLTEIAITLQFSYATGGAATEVERGTNAAGPFESIAILPQSATTYIDRVLEPGITYYYRVRATSLVADSAWTSVVSAAAVAAFPLAPTDLRLATVATPELNPSPSSVKLEWIDRADNESGFKVFRSEVTVGSPVWSEVAASGASTGVNQTVTITDLTVSSDLAYRYYVVAVNARGPSQPSSELLVQVPPAIPAVPAPFTAAPVAGDYDSVVLTWGGSEPPRIEGFRIQRQIGGDWLTLVEVGPEVSSYQHDNVLPGTVGQYRIAAFNETGSSAWAVASATTPTSFAWVSSVADTPKQVTLSWTDGLAPLEYTLQRKLASSGTYADLAMVGGTSTEYVDRAAVIAGSTYHYRIISNYAAGTVINAQVTVNVPVSKIGNQAPDYLALRPAIAGVVTNPSWQQGRTWGDFHHFAECQGDAFYGLVVVSPAQLGRGVFLNLQFDSNGNIIEHDGYLLTPEQDGTDNRFGAVIKASGDYLIIGDPGAIETQTGIRTGAVYVYRYSNNPSPQATLESVFYGPESGSEFGAAMDLDGSKLIIGAPGYGKQSFGASAGHGAVFVVDYQSPNIDFALQLHEGDARLGASVGLSGRSLVAGAPTYDQPGLTDSGYVLAGSMDWPLIAQFHTFSPADFNIPEQSNARFGAAVDIDRMLRILVGQPGASSGAGAAWCMTWNGRSAFEELFPFGVVSVGAPSSWTFNGTTISPQGYGDLVKFADLDAVVADAHTTQVQLREQLILPLIMGQELGIGRTVALANSADGDDQWVTLSSVTYGGGATFPASKFVFAPANAPAVLSVADFTTAEIPANDLRRIALRAEDDWGAGLTVTPWFVRYATSDADSDFDGIPDWWELANGLNKDVNDAQLDYDFDGLNNLQEYLANLNPHVWGLPDPDGDYDGDGIPDHLDARPTVASSGDQFGVSLTFPPNGSILVP